MSKREILISETALLDASQAILAGRLPLNKIEAILPKLDSAGYYAVTCFGDSSFETSLRYLHENPWERLRIIKKMLPSTKLQMTIRGQCLVGYVPYHDDIVRRFIDAAIENGIGLVGVYDPLNDINNMRAAIERTITAGAQVSGIISYTDYHEPDFNKYKTISRDLVRLGASSVCIRDVAGELTPSSAYRLVRTIKDEVEVPLVFHSRCKTGLGYMAYLKAVEAGADIVETAISPLSGGNSLPATETIEYTLSEYGFDSRLDNNSLLDVSSSFKALRNEMMDEKVIDKTRYETEVSCIESHLSGEFLSVFQSQLKLLHCDSRIDEIIKEISILQEDLGYPSLVPPIDRILATQAIQNVLFGERYRNVGKDMRLYIQGAYGTPPFAINDSVRIKILKGEKPISTRYADMLTADSFEKAKIKYTGKNYSDEDILSYLLFPEYSQQIFEPKAQKPKNADNKPIPFSIERVEL